MSASAAKIVMMVLVAGLLLSAAPPLAGRVLAAGTVYFVDHAEGSDDNDGRSPQRAFRRAPGDAQAEGRAAAVALQPGDVVRFKGGVVYRGTIRPAWSGTAEAPIRYDGNRDNSWGDGPAIVDGSEPITGWRPLASPDEARGNEHWRQIYVAQFEGDIEPRLMNLTQDEALFSIARDPASADPFFLDDRSTMQRIHPPRPEDRGRAAIDSSHLFSNRNHPLRLMVDGRDDTLAIIDPMQGARLDFIIPAAQTVHRVAITTDSRSTRPRDIVFLADGREILATSLPNRRDHFEFDLAEPVELSKLTLEIRSIHEGDARHGGIRRVQAFDGAGNDVLRVIEAGSDEAYAMYQDPVFFTQPHPDHWKGSYFAIHAGHNFMYYRRVLRYFPERHEIHTEPIEVQQYPGDGGRFAMLNVLAAIAAPGQFYVCPDRDADGRRDVYVWPVATGEAGPTGITASQRDSGFVISGQHHIEIAGFIVEKHLGWGVETADANHIVIRDNEIRLGRGGAIQASRGEHLRIEANHAHHNRGRGFRLHTISDGVVHDNRLHRNGSTGIGMYVCRRMAMTHNHVSGHTGVHANALTVYAESQDILIEGNRTWANNIGLTMQDVTNVIVRNNILHNAGNGMAMWTGYHRNIRIEHNAFIGAEHRAPDDWAAGLFTNGTVEGLHVHNNILAGTSGRLPGEYSHNIYTRLGPNERNDSLPEASHHVPDLSALFLAPAERDFRPQPTSPAIDAGKDLGVERDIDGTTRPHGQSPDIGPYEYRP